MNLLSFQYSHDLIGQWVWPAHGAPNQLFMAIHREFAKQDGKRIQVPLTHAARTSEAKKLQRSLTQEALGQRKRLSSNDWPSVANRQRLLPHRSPSGACPTSHHLLDGRPRPARLGDPVPPTAKTNRPPNWRTSPRRRFLPKKGQELAHSDCVVLSTLDGASERQLQRWAEVVNSPSRPVRQRRPAVPTLNSFIFAFGGYNPSGLFTMAAKTIVTYGDLHYSGSAELSAATHAVIAGSPLPDLEKAVRSQAFLPSSTV
jgi:hypothetical protein